MYYKYLPCQILSHDVDEKSDLLIYEFSILLPAITQFKNGRVQRASWVFFFFFFFFFFIRFTPFIKQIHINIDNKVGKFKQLRCIRFF